MLLSELQKFDLRGQDPFLGGRCPLLLQRRLAPVSNVLYCLLCVLMVQCVVICK